MELTLHTSFPDELREEWNLLLDETATHVPFLRHEYLQVWWETRGGGEWPRAELAVVTAREGQRLVGVAPLFAAEWQDRRALLLLGSIEVSDYLDLLARPEDVPALVGALLPFLAEHLDWEALELYNLPDSSPSLPALKAAAARLGWQYAEAVEQHAPFIQLPGDWEEYLAGIDTKQRHEIRRKLRRAEGAEVPVRWYQVCGQDGLDNAMDDFIALMRQEEAKDAFLSEAMVDHMRRTARCALEEGCLSLAFLEVDGHKAAGYLSFDYLNRLWVYNSGLNYADGYYSPGWVLLSYLIQWAIENGYEELDFMRGDEEYKYRFGATNRDVMRATITRG